MEPGGRRISRSVFYGPRTDKDTAWKIAQGGFANAAVNDRGWFGNGIYFTSSLAYARKYSMKKLQPAVVIATLFPGNPFPVIEPIYLRNSQGDIQFDEEGNGIPNPAGFYGKALEPGFQSHVVLVDIKGYPYCHPLHPWNPFQNDGAVDELVIPHGSQALPLFIVHFKPSTSESLPPISASFSTPKSGEENNGKDSL